MVETDQNLLHSNPVDPARAGLSLDLQRRLVEAEAEVSQLRGMISERDDRLLAFQQIGRAMASMPSIDDVLAFIMDKITVLMTADRATLFLVDRETGELWSKVLQGTRISEIRLKPGEGIAGWVARSGKSLNIKDAYRDERFNRNIDIQTGFQTRSCLCQPIRNAKRELIGVVQVLNKREGYFTVEDENLLSAIASQAAVVIENSQLYLSAVARNIELQEYRERLEQKMLELDRLYEIEREAAQAPDLEAMLTSVGRKCLEAIEAEVSAVTLRREDGTTVFCVRRLEKGEVFEFAASVLDREDGVGAEVLSTGRTYLCNRNCDTHTLTSDLLLGETFKTHSVIGVPLLANDQVIGCLELVNRLGRDDANPSARRGFDEDDLKLLTLIGSHISSAIATQLFRERQEKAARLSSIGQLVSSVLHDLKTPISIISGYVQLMVRQDKHDSREQYAEAVLKQFDTLNRMTKEILAFARGDSSMLVRTVFLNKFMAEAEQMLQNELMGKNIELVVETEYRGKARFDEFKLKRVFANLARNAVEAMPDGGKLTVRAFKTDDQLVFTFLDSGLGIPREIRGRLFESFVSRGKPSGTGLGLAIVKKIVDEHQGTITFDTRDGEGTEFSVRLPLVTEAA